MSQFPSDDPTPGDAWSCEAIEQVIVPRVSDIGGFEVRRALPSIGRKMIGPFVFFHQMGPSEFLLGEGLDERPHPHIGPFHGHLPLRWLDPASRQPRRRAGDPLR